MKLLYSILLAAAALFMPAVPSDAQNLREMLSKVVSQADTSCVTIRYKFTTSAGDTHISDDGFVEAQENMWHLKGQALEIYTDGTSTWVIDNDAKEVIVEPGWSFDDLESFYSSALKNGTDMKIEVVSENQCQRKPAAYFTPAFDESWIVTDLR